MVEKQASGYAETLGIEVISEGSSWINLIAYCHQKWKVSQSPPLALHWLSHSLGCSLNHLDLLKQQKTLHIFSLFKKI